MARRPRAAKGLLIIIDGLGDRPSSALGDRTPLQAAATPTLDELIRRGVCGLVDPIGPGIRVGTQVGAGVLLGFEPDVVQKIGRGVVEAAGVSLPLADGDIALRCNFATLSNNNGTLSIIDRRAGRVDEGTAELCESVVDVPVGEDILATVCPATQHRGVVRLSGTGLCDDVGDTDPGDAVTLPAPVKGARRGPEDGSPPSRTAAAVDSLLRIVFERFDRHPVNQRRRAQGLPAANGIITRGAGSPRKASSRLAQAGLSAAVVAGECTLIGLARMLGYTVITDPRFTALANTDLDGKVRAAFAALNDHDVVFIHVKATDVFAHDREPVKKRDFIERLDAALAPILDRHDLVIAVSADHSTDSNCGAHTGDPVPSILAGPAIAADGCRQFDEYACAAGALGRITAREFVTAFIAALGAKDGARPAGLR